MSELNNHFRGYVAAHESIRTFSDIIHEVNTAKFSGKITTTNLLDAADEIESLQQSNADLLEALKECVDALKRGNYSDSPASQLHDKARAAIAKAEGGA